MDTLIKIVIENMTRFLRVKSGVDCSHRESRSGIIERIPNRGVVSVPMSCFLPIVSNVANAKTLTCSSHGESLHMMMLGI